METARVILFATHSAMIPTPTDGTAWKRLLRLALRDELADIDRVGGIEQYMHALLRRAADPSSAVDAFQEALEDVVAHLTPSTAELPALRNLIDLAAAFRPREGLSSILGFLRRHIHYPVTEQIGPHTLDLRRRALQALESYYQTPPSTPFPAYEVYCDLLLQYAPIPTYAGYTLARLLELRVITMADAVIVDAITAADDEALYELVDRTLTLNNERRGSAQITAFQAIADAVGVGAAFRTAAAAAGGSITVEIYEPVGDGAGQPPSAAIEARANVINTINFRERITALGRSTRANLPILQKRL